MTSFAPTNMEEWVRQQTKTSTALDRRGKGSDLGYSGSVHMALLDDDYRGEGGARVTFEGYDTLDGRTFQWSTPYVPWGSRSVVMHKVNGTWMIAGQSGAEGYGGLYRVPLPRSAAAGKWVNYYVRQQDPTWAPWEIVRYPSGIVVHRGLMFPIDAAAAAVGTIIAIIPEMYRPDAPMTFMVNNGDLARSVSIWPNGHVTVGANWSTNYVSMSGTVAYPAAGVATWTNIEPQGTPGSDHAFLNGFLPYNSTPGDQPAYWMDPYGLVWLRGLIRHTAPPTTDNTGMFALPVSHRAAAESHIIVARFDDIGMIGASPASAGVNFKTGTGYAANQWMSLAGATIVTAQARLVNPWFDVPYFVNSYGNYPGSFTKLGMLRRGDGLGLMAGLGLAPASIGNWPFLLEEELLQRKQTLFNVLSAGARGRVDTYGFDRDSTNRPMGSFSLVQGAAGGWFSLDSIKVVAG